MTGFAGLSPEEKEVVAVLAKLDAVSPDTMALCPILEIKAKAKEALAGYYRDHTQMENSGWLQKFKDAGITEEEGKSAIACARRMGIEIG